MKWLEQILATLQSILFILTWRVTVDKEKKEDANKLAQEADDAIRTGRFDDVVIIWSRMRNI